MAAMAKQEACNISAVALELIAFKAGLEFAIDGGHG